MDKLAMLEKCKTLKKGFKTKAKLKKIHSGKR